MKIKDFLCFFMLLLLAACEAEDEKYEIYDMPYDVKNLSGVDVQISFIFENQVDVQLKNEESFVYIKENGNDNIPVHRCGLKEQGCDSDFIDVKIKFLTDPTKCISFLGAVEDESIDIRTVKSYQKKGKVIEYDFWGVQNYEYIVSEAIFKQAEPCE